MRTHLTLMFYFPNHRIGSEETAGTLSQSTEAQPISEALATDFQATIENTSWNLEPESSDRAPPPEPARFLKNPSEAAPSGAESSGKGKCPDTFPDECLKSIDDCVRNSKVTGQALSKMIDRITKASMSDPQQN